jgi:hypothetical protein
MIITVIIMNMMEVPVDKVIRMIAVRNTLVSTTRAMVMVLGMSGTRVIWSAPCRVCWTYFEHMFIDRVAPHVMKSAIV